jgi:hypothetical protein
MSLRRHYGRTKRDHSRRNGGGRGSASELAVERGRYRSTTAIDGTTAGRPNARRPHRRCTPAKLAKRLFNLPPPMLSAIADLVTHTARAQTKPADSTQRVFPFAFAGPGKLLTVSFQDNAFGRGRCNRRDKSSLPSLLEASLKVKRNCGAHSQAPGFGSPRLRFNSKVRYGAKHLWHHPGQRNGPSAGAAEAA